MIYSDLQKKQSRTMSQANEESKAKEQLKEESKVLSQAEQTPQSTIVSLLFGPPQTIGIPLPDNWEEKVFEIGKVIHQIAGACDHSSLRLQDFQIKTEVDGEIEESQLSTQFSLGSITGDLQHNQIQFKEDDKGPMIFFRKSKEKIGLFLIPRFKCIVLTTGTRVHLDQEAFTVSKAENIARPDDNALQFQLSMFGSSDLSAQNSDLVLNFNMRKKVISQAKQPFYLGKNPKNIKQELDESSFRILAKCQQDIAGVIQWSQDQFWTLTVEDGIEMKIEVRMNSGLNFRDQIKLKFESEDEQSCLEAEISFFQE